MTPAEYLENLVKTLIALEDVTDSPSVFTHLKQVRSLVADDPVWIAVDTFLKYYQEEILRQAFNEQFEETIEGLFSEEELERMAGDE